METLKLILFALAFGIFESIWRRTFGGGPIAEWWKNCKWVNWISTRCMTHVVNMAALFALCYYFRGINIWWSIYFTVVFQVLFWTTTFGMYFDIGRCGRPLTQDDIDAYNKPWFSKILNWIFPDEYRYTPYYDFCGMLIRFTYPLLLLFFVPTFSFSIVILGEIVATAYGLGWVMRDKSLLKKIGPTEFGEYISGFFAGVFLVLSGMI